MNKSAFAASKEFFTDNNFVKLNFSREILNDYFADNSIILALRFNETNISPEKEVNSFVMSTVTNTEKNMVRS